MDVVLLHNEKAGDGDRSRSDLVALLRQQGYRPEAYSFEEALQDTDRLDRGEFVIAAGGDGSVKRAALALAHRGRTIAPLPLGTANNIATSLGVRGEPEAVIAGWKHGRRRPLDLGLARGPWGERRFIEGLGVGLIGRAISTLEDIDETSHRKFERKEDKLYRDLCVLLTLAREMPPLQLDLVRDGTDDGGFYLLLEVLNIARAGPGFELAKQADSGDGQLDLVTVRAHERDRLEASLKRRLAELDHGTTLDAVSVRELTLTLRGGQLRIDDDIAWSPPSASPPRRGAQEPTEPSTVTVKVTIEPGALDVLLPGT